MQVFRHFHRTDRSPLALAIGKFDGVHLGHQALLQGLVATAQARGLISAVMTFEPHPLEFFRPKQVQPRITTMREKLELFAAAGVQQVYICHFNERFAQVSAEEFMQKILRESLNVEVILVGEDFQFGAGRTGSVADFRANGFECFSLSHVHLEGVRISSTVVREALACGNLERARELLGRPYSISGKVVHGDKVGRTLGYPTANISLPVERPLKFGIYAVKLEGVAETALPGVASFGIRPTMKQDGRPTLEVHVFDFDRQIYGAHVRVHFLHKIRDEMKFPDTETLRQWIIADEEKARNYFKGLIETR
ncbi:MAG TPA: bifunctional riboflavin kinase/FAD synthetase [Methylophilaceae bacterium]|nr:bifunctional riboflavin kinase/FAD synthetase [Methylophilaceae bacterium]